MPYPSVFLIHRCDITQRRATGVTDAYGEPTIQTSTLTAIPCRMTSASAAPGADGNICTARCTLAANTNIQEDDQLETTAAGFSKTYWINHIIQVYEPTVNSISHTILELRETEERERV